MQSLIILLLLILYIFVFKMAINKMQEKISDVDNPIMYSRSPNRLLLVWCSSMMLICLGIWFTISRVELFSGLLLFCSLLILVDSILSFESFTDRGIIIYRLLRNRKEIVEYSDIDNVILSIHKQRISSSLSYKIVLKNRSAIVIGTLFAAFNHGDLKKVDQIVAKHSKFSVEKRYSDREIEKVYGGFGVLLNEKLGSRNLIVDELIQSKVD